MSLKVTDSGPPIVQTSTFVQPWTSKTPKRYNEIESMVIFIVQKEYHKTLTKKSLS